VLGVDEHATLAEVQHAFRIKAKQTHPDHGGDRRAFEAVRAAYEAVRSLVAARLVTLRANPYAPNPYAWCDEPVPAAAPFVRPPRPRPRPSAVRFAEVLETELRKVRVASAA